MRRRADLLAGFVVLLGLVGCGGGDDPGVSDGGNGVDEVRYDETYGRSCTLSCSRGQVATACTCPTRPAEGLETNRVGCSALPTEMGRPRTFDDDFCDESADGAAPDLRCFMPGMYRPLGTPRMVTLYGVVDVFGNGGDADGIRVEVYREGPDGQLGELVGSAVASTASACKETEDEIDDDMVVGTRDLGFYQISDVPSETPLIIKTSGDAAFWRELYTYNVQFLEEQLETTRPPCPELSGAGPFVEYRARTLSRSDYTSIPLTAGLPGGVPAGQGAVAGEVHDCGDVRLEYAQVATSPAPLTLVYFNDNPSNPLPQMGRVEGTSLLGLYAALGVPPGPVDVAAVGRVGGELVSLGWYRAQVFGGAVTVVTFRGLRSQQHP
ncbi:MAG: hypothetical protein NZ898_00810 [Myxococcota bacterium]|nr:hypothetical protein [Myxococcota bacterium]